MSRTLWSVVGTSYQMRRPGGVCPASGSSDSGSVWPPFLTKLPQQTSTKRLHTIRRIPAIGKALLAPTAVGRYVSPPGGLILIAPSFSHPLFFFCSLWAPEVEIRVQPPLSSGHNQLGTDDIRPSISFCTQRWTRRTLSVPARLRII